MHVQSHLSLDEPARQEEPVKQKVNRQVIQQELKHELQLMLQVDDIDPQQSFLDMGADSIILVEAIAMIESRYQASIKISQLFEAQSTLESLAAYITEHAGEIDLPAQQEDSTQVKLAETAPTLSVDNDLIDVFDSQLTALADMIDSQNRELRQHLNGGKAS